MTREQVAQYIRRIGYTGPLEPTARVLADLQERHFYTVPYENLDILAGKRLSLGEEALFDKIVARRRGGYCFELNALFAALLRALGFAVEHYFARFLLGEATVPMRRHHVLRARTEGRDYVADVGVGVEVPRRPYLLAEGEQSVAGMRLLLERRPVLGWIVQELHDGAWRELYCFTDEPQLADVDYAAASYFCECAPESIFNKEEMVAIKSPGGGRVTLNGDELRIFPSGGDEAVTRKLNGPEEKRAALEEHFGIVL